MFCRFVEDANCADLWLLNSCTVKNPSQDSFHNAIDKGKEMGKYVVLAGCVPQGQPKNEFIKGLSVVGVSFCSILVKVKLSKVTWCSFHKISYTSV